VPGGQLTQVRGTAYYIIVAAGKRKKASGFGWFLFWLAFIIGITLLFVVNMGTIQKTLKETRVLERLFNKGGEAEAEEDEEADQTDPGETEGQSGIAEDDAAVRPPEGNRTEPPEVPPASGANPPAGTNPQGAENNPKGKTVSRAVYLIRVDNDGAILPSRVQRTLPESSSPMRDALEAVIRGPQGDEEKKGLLSLIPPRVKILNATVQGSTAYISFSEDFLFNTYGIEGYAAQLRQVVWTATEFSNVKDVQILIDGKRIDYLGEGIWIGSPVNRTAP
jgi:spore germination protein GerM